MKTTWLAWIAAPALACGASSHPSPQPTPVAPAAPQAPPATAAPAPFENPGGMWLPGQLPQHAAAFEQLGLEIPVSQLADPTQPPLSAVVSLGFCTASFVSPDGLLITNHHCVTGYLQYHSTKEHNYVETGFLAKSRAEEKWNGPTAKVWVTQKNTDVTEQVLGGLDSITDDKQRYDEIEKREKALIAACEKDRPSIRCSVRSFYAGGEYRLIEQLELRDLRLVYAPDRGVGWFGGNEDNWMWPRHTGDYAFLRVYVGKDGKPADYSKDNVPYRPAHHLPIATGDLDAGDMVMVAGYPGRTYRFRTAAEVKEAVEWTYPRRVAAAKEYLAVIDEVGKRDPEAKIKGISLAFGLNNRLKNNQGMIDGLSKGGLAAKRAAMEAELRAWIEATPERKSKYGSVFPALEKVFAERLETRDFDAALGELRYGDLLGVAGLIVRMAEERAKPDAERDPMFQERNWKRLRARLADFDRDYDRALDKALLAKAIERASKDPKAAELLAGIFGKDLAPEAVDETLERMYRRSKLENEKVRLRLFDKATSKQLARSKDPFIRAAVALRPVAKQIEDREERLAGQLALVKPLYLEAIREQSPTPVAPDANSSLRVTFGSVRGYRPTPDADLYNPFTVLSEVVAKHKDEAPFDVPDALLAAAKEGPFGPYVDEELGQVPVNFLSDLDITGGNSGSPTINAKGELCGVVFDGNYEAMASDYVFMPDVTRSIHTDIRYVLWIMDAVDGADHLLEELGVKPAI